MRIGLGSSRWQRRSESQQSISAARGWPFSRDMALYSRAGDNGARPSSWGLLGLGVLRLSPMRIELSSTRLPPTNVAVHIVCITVIYGTTYERGLSSYGEGNAALLSPRLRVRGWVRGAVVRRPEALGLKAKTCSAACRWLVSGISPDGQGKWSRQNDQGQILEA